MLVIGKRDGSLGIPECLDFTFRGIQGNFMAYLSPSW